MNIVHGRYVSCTGCSQSSAVTAAGPDLVLFLMQWFCGVAILCEGYSLAATRDKQSVEVEDADHPTSRDLVLLSRARKP